MKDLDEDLKILVPTVLNIVAMILIVMSVLSIDTYLMLGISAYILSLIGFFIVHYWR